MMPPQPTLAKLIPPRLPKIIDRTRLYRRLDQSRKQRSIIWITGPPGIGKTTLVASYLRTRKLKPLWYQVDQGDADLATFFHYFGLACRQVAPRFRTPLPHLTAEYLQVLPVFTRRYFETLYSRLKSPGVLVFDNYQEVSSDSSLHSMLTLGCEVILPGQNIIVVSRENPPAPFARLQAAQMVEHVTQDELRLNPTETAGIVRLQHWNKNMKLSPTVIEQLQTKVDGWVAGLVLMMEHIKTTEQFDVLLEEKTPQVIFEYLATEVFEKFHLEVQEFLIQVAVLPWTTSTMAQDLTGRINAEEILFNLFHGRYFTERRDEPDPIYQFHPLFSEFLQTIGREKLSEQEGVHLYQRGGTLLKESNRIDEALELYQKAGDVEQVVEIILTHAPEWIAQGRGYVTDARIQWVPKEIQEAVPWLLFWRGCALFGEDILKSQILFKSALKKFESQKDFVGFGLAWSCAVQGILFRWEDLRPLDQLLKQYESVIPDDFQFPNQNIESQVTFAMFAALMWRNPESAKIKMWASRARELLGKTQDPNQLAGQAVCLTTYYQWMGRLADIPELLQHLRKLVPSQAAGPFFRAMLLFIEAHYQWMRGAGAQCIQLAQEIEALAEESRMVGGLLISNKAAMVFGALINGDVNQAERYLEENSKKLPENSPMTRGFHHFQVGWVNYLQGDFERAKKNVELAMESNREYAGPFPASQHLIGACYANLALGNMEQATEQLKQAWEIGEGMESPMVMVMAGFAQAHLEFEKGNQDAGLVALEQAMLLAKQFEIVTFGWFLPSVIVRLCIVALEQNIEVEYAQRLIRIHQLVPSQSPGNIPNWPWPVKIWTLKPFGIHINDKPLEFSHKVPRKPLELLKALIAFGGQNVSESQLIDALWPDAEGDKGQEVFLKTLNRLRKLIGVEGTVHHRDGKVSLDPRQYWVDVWAFESLSGQPKKEPRGKDNPSHLESLEKALALYRESFLTNEDLGWSQVMQERLRTKFAHGVIALSRHLVEEQQWEKAESCLERGIEVEPTIETFYQELMKCMIQQGRQSESVRVFERCRKVLVATLGVEPSAYTQNLLPNI